MMHPDDPRAHLILAKSVMREIRRQGGGPRQVVAFATELLALAADDIRNEREGNGSPVGNEDRAKSKRSV